MSVMGPGALELVRRDLWPHRFLHQCARRCLSQPHQRRTDTTRFTAVVVR